MAEAISPALTPEEWAKQRPFLYVTAEKRHEVAAVCLHGQPFGFTREDVAFLRTMAREFSLQHAIINCSCLICKRNRAWGPEATALAARIEALLPPEGKDG